MPARGRGVRGPAAEVPEHRTVSPRRTRMHGPAGQCKAGVRDRWRAARGEDCQQVALHALIARRLCPPGDTPPSGDADGVPV